MLPRSLNPADLGYLLLVTDSQDTHDPGSSIRNPLAGNPMVPAWLGHLLAHYGLSFQPLPTYALREAWDGRPGLEDQTRSGRGPWDPTTRPMEKAFCALPLW